MEALHTTLHISALSKRQQQQVAVRSVLMLGPQRVLLMSAIHRGSADFCWITSGVVVATFERWTATARS